MMGCSVKLITKLGIASGRLKLSEWLRLSDLDQPISQFISLPILSLIITMETLEDYELSYLQDDVPQPACTLPSHSLLQHSFPITLPFELSTSASPPARQPSELVLHKLSSLVSFVLSRKRSKNELIALLGRIHDRLYEQMREGDEQSYRELLAKLIKLKAIAKDVTIDEVRGIVEREILMAMVRTKQNANNGFQAET